LENLLLKVCDLPQKFKIQKHPRWENTKTTVKKVCLAKFRIDLDILGMALTDSPHSMLAERSLEP